MRKLTTRAQQQRGHAAAAADRPRPASRRVGRPPGVRVVLVVARRPRRRRRSHAWPTSIAMPVRAGTTSASTASRSGSTDHSSSSSRASARDRVLADLDRAAGAERPAPGPASPPTRARRPASQRPVGVAHDAQHRQRAARRRSHAAAAPSASAAARARSPPSLGLEAGQPRGEAVVRGRAAVLAARRSRGRPRRRWSARRLEASPRASATVTWSGGQGPRARMPGG